MQLIDFIKTYDNVLDEKTCKDLIKAFKETPEYVKPYKTDNYNFNQLELNSTPGLTDTANELYNKLIPYYDDYFSQLGMSQFVNIESMEALRIKHYKKKSDQQFKLHVDVNNHASARRYAIAIFYLNNNDGYTIFPKLNHKVRPKVGRLVIFPPTWMFPHAGLPSTNNDKYIMMTSLHYV